MTFLRSSSRLRQRAADQGGFTIVEMMVALSILAIALVSLAYTASIGFGYSAKARQKQDAVNLANQATEQVRALAVTNLTSGMSTSDLTGDADITTCGTDDCYGGEVIVASASPPSGTPLNPHVATNIVVGPTTFTRKVYLTQVAGESGSYRVTVDVSWTDRGSVQHRIQDSVIDTTSLCPSGSLHKYAGPCQAYLTGTASVPESTVSITPYAATGLPGFLTDGADRNDSISVETNNVTSIMQVEQTAAATSTARTSGGTYLVNDVEPTSPCGLLSFVGAADLTTAYSSVPTSPSDTTCTGPSPADPVELKIPAAPAANDSYVVVRKSLADLPSTANAIGTTTATATNACSSQTDDLPCAFANIHQQGQTSALLQAYTATGDENVGTCPLVQIDGAGGMTDSTSYVNRDATTSSSDKLTVTTTRYLPTITIGCMPSNLPRTGNIANWDTTMPAGQQREYPAGTLRGYYMRFSGWTETMTVEAGVGATSTAATRSGTVTYWNGSGYTSYTVPAATASGTLSGLAASFTTPDQVITAGGRKVCVQLTPTATSMTTPAVTSTSTGSPVTAAGQDAAGPAVPDLEFKIVSAANNRACSHATAVTEVDLTISTDLSTASADATYTAGS